MTEEYKGPESGRPLAQRKANPIPSLMRAMGMKSEWRLPNKIRDEVVAMVGFPESKGLDIRWANTSEQQCSSSWDSELLTSPISLVLLWLEHPLTPRT